MAIIIRTDKLTPATQEEADILKNKGWVPDDDVVGGWKYDQEVEVADDVIIEDDNKEEQKQEETAPAATTEPSTEPATTTPDATTTKPVNTEPEIKF